MTTEEIAKISFSQRPQQYVGSFKETDKNNNNNNKGRDYFTE